LALKTISPFVLPAELGVVSAGKLSASLVERRGQSITIDAGKVVFVGGLCLQVLLAARDAWAADALPFEVVNPTDAFQGDLALLGGAADFDLGREETSCH